MATANDALWLATDAALELIEELFPGKLTPEEREAIRHDLAYRLTWAIGGLQLYFPTHDAIEAVAVREVIVRDFDGRNASELALRHGISTVAVYRILARHRKRTKKL